MANSITGRWSYRSLVNNPDLSVPFNDLRFGSGALDMAVSGRDITGSIGGEGWSLAITGAVETDNPCSFLVRGSGDIGGETWVYDYRGYVVPDWPDGVDQRDALVGSILRVAQHGSSMPGFVASWYGVRQ